ncbi:type IV toxin-antitoxin system AbiEi family antitoxin [Micromonospora maris]|uniref:type IV toxin-antitoxin system AbiEi family antitoxin n=1 Tax=Micromonospora maris TaxID=1003110 RepID=UPI002E1208E7|nr:endonuclease domain-containing protein [Micromonospora maris]
MSRSPRRPPQLRGRIFRGSRAISRGLLTRNELRSSAWRPLFRDVYADAQLPVTHRTRCAAAGRLLIPAGAAIAGRSAAVLYGCAHTTFDDTVDVLVPRGTPAGPAAGLRVHRGPVDAGDVVDRAGIPVTSPVRTCWDVASWLDLVEAVVVIDALLARQLTDVSTLRGYALARAGRRGWRAMLRAVDLADGGAESPQESRARVRLVLAGLPRPRTQWVVSAQGDFLARLDLAWPEYRVAVEYDGLWHDNPAQFDADRRRLNRVVGGDWIVLHLTAKRLREDFDGFVAEVRAALRSRGHRTGAPRIPEQPAP